MKQAGEGNIASHFRDFSVKINRFLVNKSFDESRSEFTVSDGGRKETWQYPGTITCQKSSE